MAYSFGPQSQAQGTTIDPGTTSPPVMQDEVPEPGGRSGAEGPYIRKYIYLMVAYMAVYLIYLIYLQFRPHLGDMSDVWFRIVGDCFVFTGSGIGSFACFTIARSTRRQQVFNPGVSNSRAWLSWIFIGVAGAIYTLGQIIWTWYELKYTSSELPFPAWYDPCYLAVYPLSWIGIYLLVPRARSIVGRTRLILDAAIVVLSILALTWYFILGPTIATLSGSPLVETVALAYPIGDLSLCIIAAILLFGPSSSGNAISSALSRMAAGVTILAVTDSLYGYFQLKGIYHTGTLSDWGWPTSWLFIGLAALYYSVDQQRAAHQRVLVTQADITQRNAASSIVRATIPLVLTIFTSLFILVDSVINKTTNLVQIVVVITILFILPVIRQVLTLKDNQDLTTRMQEALDQSQQAFQQSQQELLSSSSRVEQYEELRAGIENMQITLSRLARGDLNARAVVDGPLAPVAQSLNLLIDRINHWVQINQRNQILEREAAIIHDAIDVLSEGRAQINIQLTHQGIITQDAMISLQRLQKRLILHFRRLREMIELSAGHQKAMQEIAQRTQHAFQNSQDANRAATVQEGLNQIDQRLHANQEILQDLYQQSSVYVDQDDTHNPGYINAHSTQQ